MEVRAMLSSDNVLNNGTRGSEDSKNKKSKGGFQKFRPVETSQSFSVRVKASKPPVRQRRTQQHQQPEVRSYRAHSESTASESELSSDGSSVRSMSTDISRCTTPDTNGLIDPFATSLSQQRKTDFLIKFFAGPHMAKFYWSENLISEHNSYIVTLAMQQPVLFNAMMAKTLTEFRSAGGAIADGILPTPAGHDEEDTKICTTDYSYYKWRTISCLREKLDSKSLEEADIACAMAIVFLIKNEVMGGSVEELKMHLGAMRRLVGMGVTLENLPAAVKAPSLLAVNLACFICKEVPPLKPPPIDESSLSSSTVKLLQSCPVLSLSKLASAFFEPVVMAMLGSKLLLYIDWECKFVRYKEYCIAGVIAKTTINDYGILASMISRADFHLLSLPVLTELSPLQNVVRLALLIADVASIIGLPPMTLMARTMAAQLKHAMLGLEFPSRWESEPDAIARMLFWACFVGTHVSTGFKERPWFVLQLVQGMQRLKLRGKQDVLDVLTSFMYTERLFSRVESAILEEVEELREDALS